MPPPVAHDPAQHGFVVGQQVTERTAHEDLHPRAARQVFEYRQPCGVRGRAADVERVVAPCTAARKIQLGLQILRGQRQRMRVGHLEDRRDAAEHRAARAGLEGLLVHQARFAEMHLAVDDARQHVQPAGIQQDVGAPRAVQRTQRNDTAAHARDVGPLGPVGCHRGAAMHEQVGVTSLQRVARARFTSNEPSMIQNSFWMCL